MPRMNQDRRMRWLVLALIAFTLVLIPIALLVKRSAKARRPGFVPGRASIADRLDQCGPKSDARLIPLFRAKKIPYPPSSLTLVGLKQEKRMELYAAGEDGRCRFIREYPILAASGKAGPKLREGDMQVPEGIYHIESLNPNSLYHLALRVGYPNDWDREHAKTDGRTQLGGDIMIHGNQCSIGCLAMGDPASEDLFILAARTGIENITVILAPCDLRAHPAPKLPPNQPAWANDLHARIKDELSKYSR